MAQSSVTMYGTLDLGVTTVNHGLNSDPNSATSMTLFPGSVASSVGRTTGMASSGLTPSKWGIKGVEDMGSGMKTSFVLESALNLNWGNNPNGRVNDSLSGSGTVFNSGEGSIQGQMFDREASLGISGSWGELKGGRMTTTMADTIGAYDPLRVAYASSPLGYNGGYGAAGFTGEGRWDNSLKYTKSFGATTLSLGYKTAGTTNGVKQGEAMGAALEYAQGNYGVKGSWASNRDAMSVGNGSKQVLDSSGNGTGLYVPGLKITFADTNAFALVGRLTQDKLTWKGGVEVITTKNPQNANYDTAANFPAINGLPVSTVVVNGYDTSNLTQRMYWVGANYDMSSQWELSGAMYRRNDSGNGKDGSAATYYGLQSQYKLSPRTKWYASYMQSHTTGPTWTTSGATVPNIVTLSTGIVHSF